MKNLKNKIALVTGGSSGMGAATADLLAEKGATVFCAQRSKSLHEDIIADLKDVNAVVLCSGKFYYDLLEEKEVQKINNIAIVKTFFIFGNSIYLKVAHLLAPSISAAW